MTRKRERPWLYVLDGHATIAVDDIIAWGACFEDHEARIVAETRLDDGKRISTVFLGVDHNFSDKGLPLLFETMTFAEDGESLDCERCATWAKAETQHKRAVARARKKARNDA